MNIAAATYYDAKIDGLYYKFSGKVAYITFKSYTTNGGFVSDCSGEIVIPDSIAYNGTTYPVTKIIGGAFNYCNITSITIPSTVVSIDGGAFKGCSELKSLIICDSGKSLDVGYSSTWTNMAGGEGAFSECSINYVYIGRNISGGCMFGKQLNNSYYGGGSSITSFVLGDSITSISSEMALDGCEITSLIIPDNVLSIEDKVFLNCQELHEIVIGEHVQSIGNEAFKGCLFTKIYCRAEFPPTCGTDAFTITKQNCKLRVPEESVDLYKVHQDWCDFFIEALPTAVSSIALNYNTYALKGIGQSIQLTATILPADATDKTVTWTSSDESVCTVSSTGLVVATGVGTTTITATTADGGLTATCTVNVTKPVTGITLNHCEYTLDGLGKSFLLTATVTPDDATDKSVTWKSYNESVCIVANGMVVSVGYGSAVVTATTTDGGQMAFCLVTVRMVTDTADLTDGDAYTGATDETMATLTYTRTFSNTEWQALYVPFEMTYADWQADFEVARLNDVHQWDDNDDGTIDRTELEAVKMKSGKTEANTPYLIRAKSTGEKTITLTNATLYKAEENTFDVSSWNTKFTFTGTYSGISGTDMFTNGYYAMGGGRLHQAESSAYDLSPMRWYMTVTDRNGNPKSLGEVKVMVFGDDTDAISPTPALPKGGGEDTVFDLSGRRTDSPTKKGVYIKNGRKMIVR
ncbi:MAG: leucine-rich repeat protein [Bacteroidaceae bacterium]|nr:leucine-rich repeat protein [Bacteroidaceae bacterium]